MGPTLSDGAINLYSVFQVRSPRSRNVHCPNLTRNPRLFALSLVSGSRGEFSFAIGLGFAPGRSGIGCCIATRVSSSTEGVFFDCLRERRSPALSVTEFPPEACL